MVDFKTIKKYCINLPEATERRAKVEKEFTRIGIDVEFIQAVSHDNPLTGCTMSHLKILKKARKLDHVCIFEDDVAFADDFWQRINLNHPFDIFYLGGHSLSFNFTRIGHNLYKVILIGGTYAVIYNNKAIGFHLENMQNDSGADAFVGNVASRKLNAICQLPFPVYTNDRYSFINKGSSAYGNPMWQYEAKWDVSKEYVLKETIIENPSLYA
jgi:GR25 family glycosyltransferase involved in LPS biosynthesis